MYKDKEFTVYKEYYDPKRKAWRQSVVTTDGKRKIFSAKNKKDLPLLIAMYREEIRDYAHFENVAEQWKEEHWEALRMGSLRSYAPCLERAIEQFGNEDIESIKPREIQAWLNYLGKTYAHKTVSNHKTIVMQIFDYAILNMQLDMYNPCERVKIPSGLRKSTRGPLSQKELDAVLSTKKDEFQLAYLILFTGCRLGEALALQMKDVDFKRNVIYITKSVGFKGNQPTIQPPKTNTSVRKVPLLPQLKERLRELKLKPDEYIVSGDAPLTKMKLQRRWESWCSSHDLAEIIERKATATDKHTTIIKPTIDRHTIRHHYATMLYESGIDAKSAQMMLGHAQISTTLDIYTHVRESKQEEDFNRLASYTTKLA